ncbi:MAG: NADH-quinone oxidoreductase subunit [Rhodospirillaceae bacterium]|nr:NADH-quinone oxidoreductase subunit [Rhodospirillaceae bacterium]
MSTVEPPLPDPNPADFTPAEREKIDAILRLYHDKRAAVVDVLKIVQRHRGWVSDESLRAMARLLDVSAADIDAVATFYNLIFRRPVGRNVILLCDSVTCWILGYERIRQRLKERLGTDFGGTSADGRFTLLPTVCLGACDHAPALMVNDDLHLDVDSDHLDSILERYR